MDAIRAELQLRLRALLRRAGLSSVPQPVLGALAVLCLAAVLYVAWQWWPRGAEGSAAPGGRQTKAASAPVPSRGERESRTPSTSTLPSDAPGASAWVHVVGAVRRPGVYEVSSTARVQAAIDAAGGLLGNAAPEGVNLARLVQDGEQIVVPTKDDLAAGTGASGGGGALAQVPGGPSAAPAAGTPVDINSADAALLDTLPGVGPSTAAKIVADREANGPFASVDDLGRVPGIGPKKLDALRDLVRVR